TSEVAKPFIESAGIAPRFYYNAIRFVRYAEALERSAGPLLMIDVDALVTGDVRPLLEWKMPVALRVRAGRLEPWNQLSACFVLGNAAARPYFRRVADIVKADLKVPFWGLDQYALFSAYLALKPEVTLV